jgi:HTH-type transcriptional regulator / antitoxin HigA
MIPTSNQPTYIDLLIEHQPKPIKTEADYQKALAIVEAMMSRELTEAEAALFELLVLLIETYEEQYYPMETSTLGATLESLMHEFDVEPDSLVEIIGSPTLVGEVIKGNRELSKSQIESLVVFFNNLNSQLCLRLQDFK